MESTNITEDVAKSVASAFLNERYPSGKIGAGALQMNYARVASIVFEQVISVTLESGPAYRVEGTLTVRSGSLLAQYMWPADKFKFKIWVSKQARRVLYWEMQ